MSRQRFMAKKIILKGIVQGVGCRGYTARYARIFGLKGSATNLNNGTVRLLIDCDDDKIISAYVSALIQNPKGIMFYGKITDFEVNDYDGKITGDYVF